MSITRRGFLKILGGATVAAVVAPKILLPEKAIVTQPVAPLFVPAQNLDMGVPKRILTATEMPAAPATSMLTWENQFLTAESLVSRRIPMLLLHDEFMREHGGKLRAGSEVLVDQTTADRWIRNGIAEPGPSAPREMQVQSAQRRLERRSARLRGDDIPVWYPGAAVGYDAAPGVYTGMRD